MTFVPETLLHPFKMQFLLKWLMRTEMIPGSVYEIGVYKGGTLLEIAKHVRRQKTVVGYDTFEGLPDPQQIDLIGPEGHKKGDFSDVNYTHMRRFFVDYGVQLVKGHFPWSSINRKVAFAHLDVDFYEATNQSLGYLFHWMARDGVIVCDDYGWPKTPGVEKAVNECVDAGFFRVLEKSSTYQIVLGVNHANRSKSSARK